MGLAPLVIRSVRPAGPPDRAPARVHGRRRRRGRRGLQRLPRPDRRPRVRAAGLRRGLALPAGRGARPGTRPAGATCSTSSILCRYLAPHGPRRRAGGGQPARPASGSSSICRGETSPSYVEGMSKNRKKRIYYYRRRMEKEGGLAERRVQSAEEIPFFLAEIARLNRQRQGEKGESSAWRSEQFRRFHAAGGARACSRAAGWTCACGSRRARCVAALYNLVYAGTIYYYQSGFDTPAFGNVSPGLLTLSRGDRVGLPPAAAPLRLSGGRAGLVQGGLRLPDRAGAGPAALQHHPGRPAGPLRQRGPPPLARRPKSGCPRPRV